MSEAILVLNAGSSSVKFSMFRRAGHDLEAVLRGAVDGLQAAPGAGSPRAAPAARCVVKDAHGAVLAEQAWTADEPPGHAGAVEYLLEFLRTRARGLNLAAVGHRVVHGGVQFRAPTRIDADVIRALEQLVPLAPLHQPHNLAPIRALLERAPTTPQVACFDTAFHAGMPPVAQLFALPLALAEAGVRRYGFHGLSYESIAAALPQVDPRAAAGRTIVLHLGNGSSMCALQAGGSVASTMGFTALDGLPMGTRCGALDPGVVLYLMRERGLDHRAIERLLYEQSGLLGISGRSADMRALLGSDDPRARLAIDLYVYRIRRELGSLAAALGGLDALVITGGIGENAATIRARVGRDAAWLGLRLDEAANAAGGPRISAADSPVAAWVLPTQEELMIARHTLRVTEDS